jgi:hypothetical protein
MAVAIILEVITLQKITLNLITLMIAVALLLENIKYVLHGLEQKNSNALMRTIVFHSWEKVTDEEVYPNGTPEGWSCPTLLNNSFKIVDPLL